LWERDAPHTLTVIPDLIRDPASSSSTLNSPVIPAEAGIFGEVRAQASHDAGLRRHDGTLGK